MVSCFPAVLLSVPARSARSFKAFPRLARSGTPLPAVFPPHSASLLHSHSLHHLYSQTPRALTRRFIVLAALVPTSRDTEEAITARRGQIGWGSYLGRIMFDILHHYQLPPSHPRESYLSLADVPLSVMNFLCPPTSSPPYLAAPRLQLRGCSSREKRSGGKVGEG